MLKMALKSLLGHKLRMLLTVFSIVIGVSFVAGTYIFTDSMSKTFDGIFEDAFATTDLTVRAKQPDFGFSTESVPESLLNELQSVEGVDKLFPEVTGTAQLIDAEGELIGTAGPFSLGFSWTENEALNPLKIDEGNGRPPLGPGEVAIDVNAAQLGNLAIGDFVTVQAAGPAEDFEIVGLVRFGEANTLAGATISVFEFNEAQRVFDLEGEFSQINLVAVDGVSAEQLKERVDATLSDDFESITGQEQVDESLDDINTGLGFINTALLAFAGISIFVGSFIIQNTFRIIVAQRSKELALLRSIGATRNQVIKLVVYEAFIVSVFASAIGILLGIGISNALRGISNAIGLGLPPGELSLEPRTVYVSFAVGIFVTILSSLIPAFKASRITPVEGMRDTEGSSPTKSLRKRSFTGLIIAGLGAALLLYGLFSSVASPIIYVGVGAGVMFIGISVIAPLLSRPIANLVGYPVRLRYGLIGQVAQENTKRTPRRTASTAAALMIGVSLVTFVSIFASSIKATIDQVIDGSFPGDFAITSKLIQTDPFGATLPETVNSDLAGLDEVGLVTGLKYDFVKFSGDEQLIIAIEKDKFAFGFNLKPSGGNYDSLAEDTVYVNEKTLESKNLSIGDSIDVEYAETGSNTLEITGSFEEAFDSPYLISSETYVTNFTNRQDLFVIANKEDGVTHDDAKAAINATLEDYPLVQSQDKGELIVDAREQIDQLLGLMSALLGFAVIIAMLGITNTLTLSVSERTREIGMLRAIGMTRSQIRRMIRAEAVIIAVFGAILGVVMGIFFGWAILRSLEDIGFSAFSIPTVQVVSYLFLAAIAGVIAAILPSYKASRMKILDAINYE